MTTQVLLVSTMTDATACAATMQSALGVGVDVAITRREAFSALRRGEFAVVVIDESLAEGDPEWADRAWLQAGLAIPMEVNFAITARTRLVREVRGALQRRRLEKDLARREATVSIGSELKGSVTGLLLETQLTLRVPGVPAALTPKLLHLVELCGELRERLNGQA